MNKNILSPYIRVAMHSTLTNPFKISERVIYDYEIIFVSGGKCKITIDGREHLCKKNDVVFLRPDVPHKFECVGDVDFVQPHIHFDACYDDKSQERTVCFKNKTDMNEYEKSLFQADILRSEKIPDVFTPYDISGFQKIFFRIIEIFQNKTYNYELLYKSEMLKLLHMLLSQFDKNEKVMTDTISGTIISIKNYIDSNYLSNITLDSLANQFYINKFTMMRRFKSLYSQSIMTYYNDKRITYAKSVLETTTVPVHILAESLCFLDIYSFSRFFKRNVGCSPTDFRMRSRQFF